MPNHGVYVSEQATAVSTPVVAECGVPFVVGLAPSHSAASPGKPNTPILVTSWDEAVEMLGFSYNWKEYTLCEFMYSHFQLFTAQPVVFCNVLDVAKNQDDLPAKEYVVADHKAVLPFATVASSIKVEKALADYASSGIVCGKDDANTVLSRTGQPVTNAGDYTFYKVFDTTIPQENDYIFVVEAGGKSYGVTAPKSERQGKEYTKLYFTLANGKQTDFVNGEKKVGDESGKLDLSTFTGEVKLSLYSCKCSEDNSTYPTDLVLIEEQTIAFESGAAPQCFVADEDYSVVYDADEDACFIELLSSGSAYEKKSLSITGKTVKTDGVAATDIVAGLGVIDACMSTIGIIPDLICAPGYSHITTVAAVMAAKAASINGLFRAKAILDLDSSAEGVREYSTAVQTKTANNFVDENQILCWPMVKLGDYRFHMSTQLAGLMAQLDTTNGGCPYESPSNKNYQMDGACLEDGTEVNLTLEQANILNANGIVTALNFMSSGWTCWGNYTACYPGNTDVKDYLIPISRMFDWVGNSLIRTFWSKIDNEHSQTYLNTLSLLCNAIPELTEYVDLETGAIEGGTAALRAQTEAWKQNAEAQAYQEYMNSLYDEYNAVMTEAAGNSIKLTEAQIKLETAEKNRAAAVERMNELAQESAETGEYLSAEYYELQDSLYDYDTEISQAERTIKNLNKAIEEDNEAVAAAEEEINSAQEAIEQLTGATAEQAEAEAEAARQTEALNGVIDTTMSEVALLVEAYNDAYGAAYESVSGQYALWDEAAEVVATSAGSINDALESQITYWDNYNQNLESLRERTADIEGLSDVIASFADGSSESVNAIAGMASASDEDLAAMVANWQSLQQAQADASQSIADLKTDFSTQMDELQADLAADIEAMDMGVEAANSGAATLQGYLDGVNSKLPQIEAAFRRLKTAAGGAMSTATGGAYVPERGYASGTENAVPGFAVVGERGPELVYFNGGEKVMDATATAAVRDRVALSAMAIGTPGGGGSTIQVTFQIQGNASPETVAALRDYGDEFAEHVLDVIEQHSTDAGRRAYR